MTTYVREKQHSLFGHTYLGAHLEAADKELSVELLRDAVVTVMSGVRGAGGRGAEWVEIKL